MVDDEDLDIIDDEEFEDIDDDVEIIDEDDIETVDDAEPESGAMDDGEQTGSGLPDDDSEHPVSPLEESRRLAEQFDRQLSAMDRYYNSYLNIPKGTYRVGSPSPLKHELPERQVWVDEFFMGKYPITNSLFEVFVAKTGYRTTAEKTGHGLVYTGRFKKTVDKKTGQIRSTWMSSHRYDVVKGACWYHPEGPGSSLVNRLHHPVVQVSQDDALAFAAWIGKSLPTEVQWEAAARTDKGYAYPWGNQWVLHACNMEDSAVSGTTAVDHYLDFMNDFHLADLVGNVLEWTCDSIPSPYNATKNMRFLVAKGGSFISSGPVPLWSRFVFKEDYTSNIVGFRCSVQ
jgi:formylglycine-generating enzyme required for sulfatase activity